jgi:electron transport complex protein RnfG
MSKENKRIKKNSIIKDALVVCVITMIAGFALGLVHEVTLPAIEARHLQTKIEAYQTVFPEAAEFPPDETLTLQAEEAVLTVLEPKGYKNITIDEACIATDEAGNKLGYVLVVTTQNGYGGAITISLGYASDGTVKGMEVLSINETAGMGALAAKSSFKNQFANKKVEQFKYTKTGATEENEIDAISGATITTSAVVDAMNSGISFITDLVEAGNNLGGE